jgi:hypothetical protein
MPYIGSSPYQVAFLTDTFSGTGTATSFTMSVAPANTASVLVAISGVVQDPSTYSVSGTTLTFSAAPPSGTGNISARYLGIPASGVTTTAYRTVTNFTATAGQTTFTPPSYTVGFINVYRNGVLLGTADYTASNGTTVVLATGATAGDLIITESFYVSSVLNAIPATANSVANSYLGTITTLNTPGSNTATFPSATGTVMVSGNMPAFSAYYSGAAQTPAASTFTKIIFNTEDFDTANCFDSTTNYRFTPTVAGYYQINLICCVGQNGSLLTNYVAALYKNGVRYASTSTGQIANGGYGNQSISLIIFFNGSTDYVEAYINPQFQGYYPQSTDRSMNLSGSLVRTA